MELIHKGTVKLETKRIILRKWQLSDAEDLFEILKEPEISEFETFPPHKNITQTRNKLEDWTKYRDTSYNWAIVDKSSSKVIGWIAAHTVISVLFKCELGFFLKKSFWGKGFMSEAVQAVLKFFFEEIGMNRIEARCMPENTASRKNLERNGFVYEGCLRESYLIHTGKFADQLVFSILKSEYEAVKNEPKNKTYFCS